MRPEMRYLALTALMVLAGAVLLPALRGAADPVPASPRAAAVAQEYDGTDVDIQGEIRGQAPRREFAHKYGLTDQQFQRAMLSKARAGKMKRQLDRLGEALTVTLTSTAVSTQDKQLAALRFLALRDLAIDQYREAQIHLLQAVGGDAHPLAVGALIVLGAVDSGLGRYVDMVTVPPSIVESAFAKTTSEPAAQQIIATSVSQKHGWAQGRRTNPAQEFALAAGLSRDQYLQLAGVRFRLQHLQKGLHKSVIDLSQTMLSDTIPQADKIQAVKQYQAQAAQVAQQSYDLEQTAWQVVGGGKDPVATAVSLLIGAGDSGVRKTCVFSSSPVSGGAQLSIKPNKPHESHQP